jgi:hypothetical protein
MRDSKNQQGNTWGRTTGWARRTIRDGATTWGCFTTWG